MQPLKILLGSKSDASDVPLYSVAAMAEQATRPVAVMAMVGAWVAFAFGFAVPLPGIVKSLTADSTAVSLRGKQGVKLLGGKSGTVLAHLIVVLPEKIRVAFGFNPNFLTSLFSFIASSSRFASRNNLWAPVVFLALLLNVGPLMVEILFGAPVRIGAFVGAGILSLVCSIFIPLLGGAICFSQETELLVELRNLTLANQERIVH